MMRLDRWIVYGNCLVGYVYDDPQNSPGQRIKTDAVRFIDPINMYAETLDAEKNIYRFKLCDPGTVAEHHCPIIGQKVAVSDIQMLNSIKQAEALFINPEG